MIRWFQVRVLVGPPLMIAQVTGSRLTIHGA